MDPKNKWTYKVDGLRREIAEQKAFIEDLKEEAEKRARTHETAIVDIQNKDRIIAGYRSKTETSSGALKVMPKVGTSADVNTEGIRDLVANICSRCCNSLRGVSFCNYYLQ